MSAAPETAEAAALERNLRLLPAFEAARNLLFWLPVFFLYFSSLLRLDQVLLLEGAYYFAKVLFEVPSGWFSDRVGRRQTLLIAMTAQVLGCALFAACSTFTPFLLAQVLLAVASAFVSGTNQALLYDSLARLGREHEVGTRSQTLVGFGFLALALASLAGGLLAGFDLRIAYLLAASASVAAWIIAWRMHEPNQRGAERAGAALRELAGTFRQRALLWVFAFSVGMTVLNHVPYEFLQPYIGFLTAGEEQADYALTPALSGGLFCVMMLLSAASASRSVRFGERLGQATALLFCLVLQSTIIVCMTVWVHPAVLLVIALRSVPMGLSYPLMSAIIQPRVPSSVRATYLSVQSLAGSLAFSGSLFVTSAAVGGVTSLSEALMARVLLGFSIVAAVLLALLACTAGWLGALPPRDSSAEA